MQSMTEAAKAKLEDDAKEYFFPGTTSKWDGKYFLFICYQGWGDDGRRISVGLHQLTVS
jgi:hypothetical protein